MPRCIQPTEWNEPHRAGGQMKWKMRATAAAAAALLLAGTTVPAALAAEEDEIAPQPIEVTTLAEVTPLGLKVTGVALEYASDLGAGSIPESAFSVVTDLPSADPTSDPDDFSRTVLAAYTSSAVGFQDDPVAGNFIILEISEEDDRAGGMTIDVHVSEGI